MTDKGLEIAALLIDVLSAYVLAKRIMLRAVELSHAATNAKVRHLRAV